PRWVVRSWPTRSTSKPVQRSTAGSSAIPGARLEGRASRPQLGSAIRPRDGEKEASQLDPRRQLLPTAHRRCMCRHRLLVIDSPLGPTRQHLVECDAAFETREAGSEAEMDAVAEAQVADVLALHVEAVRVFELPL